MHVAVTLPPLKVEFFFTGPTPKVPSMDFHFFSEFFAILSEVNSFSLLSRTSSILRTSWARDQSKNTPCTLYSVLSKCFSHIFEYAAMTFIARHQTKHLIDSQHLHGLCRSGVIQKRQYMLSSRETLQMERRSASPLPASAR